MSENSLKILIALGGNAILKRGEKGTAEEQLANVRRTTTHLIEFVRGGEQIAVTHGNGPQVGDILLKNELSKARLPPMPLDYCVAESQGMIGYMLQQSMYDQLVYSNLKIPVITVLSQTLVDRDDPAFQNPTKPIGPYYSSEQASLARKQDGWIMVESKDGFRRAVPSPIPKSIIELETIRMLFEKGVIVIHSGGGGIPVVQSKNGSLVGVEAVIDKDLTAALLASAMKMDAMLILTDVARVSLNYNLPDEQPLGGLSVEDCKTYLNQGQFAAGSMQPKIEAAIHFIEDGGRKVVITSLEGAKDALYGGGGTTITE